MLPQFELGPLLRHDHRKELAPSSNLASRSGKVLIGNKLLELLAFDAKLFPSAQAQSLHTHALAEAHHPFSYSAGALLLMLLSSSAFLAGPRAGCYRRLAAGGFALLLLLAALGVAFGLLGFFGIPIVIDSPCAATLQAGGPHPS